MYKVLVDWVESARRRRPSSSAPVPARHAAGRCACIRRRLRTLAATSTMQRTSRASDAHARNRHRRDRSPASHRSGDLHPLQYLRGDRPVDAVSHDSRNYVVDATKCNFCNECISPCPTGAIDNWRQVDRAKPYTLVEQSAGTLPAQGEIAADAEAEIRVTSRESRRLPPQASGDMPPPWSAAHPYVNLYTVAKPAIATVTGNFRSPPTRVLRHPASRPRLRRRRRRSRRPDDRDRAAGTDANGRPHHAPLFGRKPARGRTAALQQPVAHGEARHRGSRRRAGARRRVELSLRPGQGCPSRGRRAVRHVVPDAEPPGFEHPHDLHRHGFGRCAR